MIKDDDALVHPVMGPKPDALGRCCIMAANAPDVDALHRAFSGGRAVQSRRLFQSHLRFGYEATSLGLAGPFLGAPYGAALLESLIAWGISEVIFLGWCGNISENVRIGDVIVPSRAFIDDGTSRNYLQTGMLTEFVDPSPVLQSRIKTRLMEHGIAFHEGPVWSTDAIFRETPAKIILYREKGALAVEMEAAALFSVGAFRKVKVGCVLVVSDDLSALKWQPGFRSSEFKARRREICQCLVDF